jgi:hypothetical protein
VTGKRLEKKHKQWEERSAPMDTAQLAAAATVVLSPFVPFLVNTGKAAGKKLAETIAQKGGEATWKTAQSLWTKITDHLGDDQEVKGAAIMVAHKPEDENRQTMLAEVLGARLQENPALAEELLNLLGGQKAVQQVLADHGSWVENVTQRMQGSGIQTIKASNDSVITGVRQIKD